ADDERRSRLCERRDAGRARADALRLKGPTDRDVLAQRQAWAFLRELATRRRRRTDQNHRPGMSPDWPRVSREDAPETRADAVRAGIRRRVRRCGELGFFIRDDRARPGRRFRTVDSVTAPPPPPIF